MSATQTSTDDGRTDLQDGDHVTNWTHFHGRLANRLNELAACVPENYYMTVEYTPREDIHGEMHDRVSVTIDSDDWIGNKGELGDSQFHVLLGEQGGLRIATVMRTLGTDRNYLNMCDTTGRAWRRLKDGIERAE